MRKFVMVILTLVIISAYPLAYAADKVLFSFEKSVEGWEIPDWAYEKDDHVGRSLGYNGKYAQEGKGSLELITDFPGASWTAAYIETVEYFDWTAYSAISMDVYLPDIAPSGLKGKIILTQGEDWAWREMSRSVSLDPGKWTTIKADIKAGSADWKRVTPDDAFRQDVRKLGIRIESNLRPIYKGPIYIDNIKLIE